MDNIYHLLNTATTGPYATIAGLILAIMGIGLSFFFYKKSIRTKLIYWDSRGRITVDERNHPKEDPSELQILFRGEPVQILSVDRIIIWNGGTETIKNEDLVAKDRLRLEVQDNAIILDAKIFAKNKDSCDFAIQRSDCKKFVTIEFDYIDKNDGLVIQLITTSQKQISIRGHIKGGQKPKYHNTAKTLNTEIIISDETRSKLPLFISKHLDRWFGFGVVIFAAAIITIEAISSAKISRPLLALLSFYAITGATLIFSRNKSLPHGLESFYEELESSS